MSDYGEEALDKSNPDNNEEEVKENYQPEQEQIKDNAQHNDNRNQQQNQHEYNLIVLVDKKNFENEEILHIEPYKQPEFLAHRFDKVHSIIIIFRISLL